MNKTSDYVQYEVALTKGMKLINDDKKCIIGFYIVLSINIGTRVGDTLRIKHSDLKGDKIFLKEKKTKKVREITLNSTVKRAYQKLTEKLDEIRFRYDMDDFVFVSQKGTVYRTQSINVILKKIFNTKKLQISSHSLRKSFSRKIYDNMHQSEHALVLLSDLLSHSNISITRRYLGIRDEIIENIYLELEQ